MGQIIHWTNRVNKIQVNKYERDVGYQRVEKSAVTKHAKNCGQEIQHDKGKISNKEGHFGKKVYNRDREISRKLQQEDGKTTWKIGKTWLPIIYQEKRRRKTKEYNIITEKAPKPRMKIVGV